MKIHRNPHEITTQRAIRAAFWQENPDVTRRPGSQTNQPADTCMAFCDWLDYLARSGRISESLAQLATP